MSGADRPADDGSAAVEIGRARARAEHGRERLVRLCADLVAAPSAIPEGDTRAAAAVLAAYLGEAGLAPELRAARPEKPNLVCTVARGAGPHIVLNGHLDTLAAGDPASWSVPPDRLTRVGGRLHGLGIGNMKAGTAALAMALVDLATTLEPWAGRVTLTAVADEVTFGPDGAAWLLAGDPSLLGDALVNGEGPGGMGVALAEKGLLWVEITVAEAPGQGMLTVRGGSAVARLAGLLTSIDAWNDEQATPPAGFESLAAHAGAHRLRLSANVGRIEGGSFISQMATTARAEVDLRLPPGLTVAEIGARLDRLTAGVRGAAWRTIKGWDPNGTLPESPVVAAVTGAAMAIRGAADPVVRLPASDAARWRARGVPAVCFGPQPGLASGVDDHVLETDVVDCVAVYALAVRDLLRRLA